MTRPSSEPTQYPASGTPGLQTPSPQTKGRRAPASSEGMREEQRVIHLDLLHLESTAAPPTW
jgi:hypothetical protein